MPRLATLKVSVPSVTTRLENNKNVVFYNVMVRCVLQSGVMTAWQIFARYTEFAELHANICSHSSHLDKFPFPPKRIINGPQSAEDRRVKFEEFLRLAVRLEPLPIELFLFLELDTNTSLNKVQYYSSANNNGNSNNEEPFLRSKSLDGSEGHRLLIDNEKGTSNMINGAADADAAVTSLRNNRPSGQAHDRPRLNSSREQKERGLASRGVAEGGNAAPAPRTGLGGGGISPLMSSMTLPPGAAKKSSSNSGQSRFFPGTERAVFSPLWRRWAIALVVFTALVVVCRLGYVVYYVAFKLTLASAWKWVTTTCFSAVSTVRYTTEVVLVLLLLWLPAHRFLGMLATWYLTATLNHPQTGAFAMRVGWVSLRIGLDLNELVLYDVFWDNPPHFKRTPYFFHVECVIVKFKLSSILHSLISGNDWHIIAIEFESLNIYMEKDKKGALNLWAAVGAEAGSSKENEVKSSAINSVIKAIETMQSATAGLAGGVADTIMKYNPVTLLVNTLRAYLSSNDAESNKNGENGHENGLSHRESAEGSSSNDAKNKAPEPPPLPGWGIPFKFSVRRLTIRKLKLFAQDFLNASHSSFSDSTAIEINMLEMKHEHLREHHRDKVINGPGCVCAVCQNKRAKAKQSATPNDSELLRSSIFSSKSGNNGSTKDLKLSSTTTTGRKAALPPAGDSTIGSDTRSTLESAGVTPAESNGTSGGADKGDPNHNDEDFNDDRGMGVGFDGNWLAELKPENLPNDGLYLDALVWRLVGRLVSDLLLSNSGGLLKLLIAAAANNAATGAANAMMTGVKGTLEGAMNLNPFAIAAAGVSRVQKFSHHADDANLNIQRSPDLEDLGVREALVRVVSARNVKYMGQLVDSAFILISFSNQPPGILDKSSKFKSTIRHHTGDEEENLIEWNEEYELGKFYTLDTIVHVRLFEYKVARKDLFIGEVKLPLVKIMSKLEFRAHAAEKERTSAAATAEPLSATTPLVVPEKRSKNPLLNEEVIDWYPAHPKLDLPDTGGEIEVGVTLL